MSVLCRPFENDGPLMYNLVVDNAVPFKHRHDLERRFVRHGDRFNAKTADEYEKLADDFMTKALGEGTSECCRPNGDFVRFDPKTLKFRLRAAAGYIRTFMVVKTLPSDRLTAWEYYLSNCR